MAQKTSASRLQTTEYDAFARKYYDRLINGQVEKDEEFPAEDLRGWGIYFKPAFDCYQIDLEELVPGELDQDDIAALYAKAGQSAAQSFKNQRNVNTNLNELLRSTLVVEEEEEIVAAPVIVPDLPDIASLDYSQGAPVREWLDSWISYAGIVLDGAPRIHLEGAGLFALSALIARRVAIKGLPKTYYPNLYLALTSKSSTGKSSIAELAVNAISDMNLGEKLIMIGNWSPQLLTQRAAGKPDPAYANMDEDERAEELERMSYAGFQSWFFDELGKFLLKLNSQGNNQQTQRMSELLLGWYYGKGISQGSVTYGTDRVKEVYLSIIGCMTISNVRMMQKMGSGFWEDGMFSRIIVLCPPPQKWRDVKIASGNDRTPDEILEPLQKMHNWLGEPEAKIIEKEVGRGTTIYKLERKYVPEFQCMVTEEVKQLYENYYNATGRLASDDSKVPTAIESSYKRLAEYALKVACLLACVHNRGILKPIHWIAAQEITEGWRRSIHEFYEQVFQPEQSKDRQLEDRILLSVEKFSKQGKWVTPTDLRRATGLSTGEIARVLDALETRKMLTSCYIPHPKRPKSPIHKYAMFGAPLPLNAQVPEEE
jgi:hypothetical protein